MDARLRRIADYLLAQPDAAAIAPAAVDTDLLPHLFWLDIERNGAGQDLRLRIRLVGTAIDKIFRRPLKSHISRNSSTGRARGWNLNSSR